MKLVLRRCLLLSVVSFGAIMCGTAAVAATAPADLQYKAIDQQEVGFSNDAVTVYSLCDTKRGNLIYVVKSYGGAAAASAYGGPAVVVGGCK